jgi:hypothetical protein
MRILQVASGGFGDVSCTTSWPRLFSEKGHELDVFLMKYTGNPFHANPFVRKLYTTPINNTKAAEELLNVINNYSYDFILVPNINCGGMAAVVKITENMKNVITGWPRIGTECVKNGLPAISLTNPEWHFTENELEYVKNLKLDKFILFFPLCSDVREKTRNISFELIKDCAKHINIVVVNGGRDYLPVDCLKDMEKVGINVIWEGYNCFNDKSGTTIGKFLALESQCQTSVHGYSGSICIAMGYNKPYVVVVPEDRIRNNSGTPYLETQKVFERQINAFKPRGSTSPNIWCMTDKAEIVLDAITRAQNGETIAFKKEL